MLLDFDMSLLQFLNCDCSKAGNLQICKFTKLKQILGEPGDTGIVLLPVQNVSGTRVNLLETLHQF